MTATTLDPLQPLVLRLMRAHPGTTEEIRARLVDEGESLPPTRLSAILHDLHASKRIEIHRHCDIRHSRLPVRQEWHIA